MNFPSLFIINPETIVVVSGVSYLKRHLLSSMWWKKWLEYQKLAENYQMLKDIAKNLTKLSS